MIAPKSKYKHIIWDWNGTLLDDAWLFVDVMNTVLKQRNMKPITTKQYRKIFGFPVRDYYLKLGFDLENEPFEESGMEFIREFEKRKYEANFHKDALKVLKILTVAGITHSVLSAQQQATLDSVVDHYGVRSNFMRIIGLSDHHAFSKVENAYRLMSELHFNANEVLMIGDTDHDHEVAESIGVDCVLVSCGHQNIERLECTYSKIIDTHTDMLNIVFES